MKQSVINKLQNLLLRYQELGHLLSQQEIITSQDKFRAYSQEYAEIEPVAQAYNEYVQLQEQIKSAQEMLADPEMRELATEEIHKSNAKLTQLEQTLNKSLLPKDPNDTCNTFVEIRAGTGGDEAAIFVGDLLKMYIRYAEKKSWKIEVVSDSPSEQGGYKEIILRVIGKDVYSQLKFESGAHRVQRVPATESQGRIHTSACTVAIMPEVESISEVAVDMADVRVDTYRASGAGGQHVNRTDSAVRLTHLPTGTVVECQDERSQHKNKAKAMSLLQAKILAAEQAKQSSQMASTRRNLIGSGDRSERIRTYNFPQGRVTDHRINLTLYKLDEVLSGNLYEIIGPLTIEHQADLMSQLTQE